jgi:hypothetical protein
MSLANVGAFAMSLLSQPLSLLSELGSSQSTSSSSGAGAGTSTSESSFASLTPSISGAIGSAVNNLTGSTSGSLSNQVMGTLLQAQEAGSSATNAISQMGQAAQQQNSGQPNQYHPFANAFTQLLQNIDQAAGNATAGASSVIGSVMGSSAMMV